MSKNQKPKPTKEQLEDYRREFGVLQTSSEDEVLTEEEKSEYLMYQQLFLLKNIGYYLQFFVVLTIIALIIGGIFVLSAIFF